MTLPCTVTVLAACAGSRKAGVKSRDRTRQAATAVEIYVNGGEVVFATRYYPETQEQAVKLEAVECDGKIYVLKNYVME